MYFSKLLRLSTCTCTVQAFEDVVICQCLLVSFFLSLLPLLMLSSLNAIQYVCLYIFVSPPLHIRAKRSWFVNLRSDKDKEVVVVYRDKSFTELRSSILLSFSVSHVTVM